jgi:hypothetical protein
MSSDSSIESKSSVNSDSTVNSDSSVNSDSTLNSDSSESSVTSPVLKKTKKEESKKEKTKKEKVEKKSKNLQKIIDGMNKIPAFASLKKIAEANNLSITSLNGSELSKEQLYKKIKILGLHLPKSKEIKDKRPKLVTIDKRLLQLDKSQIIVNRAGKKEGEKSKQLKRHEEALELNKIKQDAMKKMELRKIYDAEEKSRFDFMFNLSITSDEEIIGNAIDEMLERLRQVVIDGDEEPFLELVWEDSILFYTLLKKCTKKDIGCYVNNPLHEHSTILLGRCLKDRDDSDWDDINELHMAIREGLLSIVDREKMEQWKNLANDSESISKREKIEELKVVRIELEVVSQLLSIKKNITKREKVKSDFEEDEEVDKDTLNNELVDLLRTASVYITQSMNDYPKHIKTMYDNRDKALTYDECLQNYIDDCEEKCDEKVNLGYEDYVYAYRILLNELKNNILQLNGDIGVLQQYIAFLHKDEDEELNKQHVDENTLKVDMEIEKLKDKGVNYERQLTELMLTLEMSKNSDNGISTNKNVNEWLSDNVERTRLLLETVTAENKDEAKNMEKWLVEDMAKYRLKLEKVEIQDVVDARKNYLFYKNKQEQIELLLRNKLYCETKIKQLSTKDDQKKKETEKEMENAKEKENETIRFLIKEFYDNNEDEILEEIAILEKQKEDIKHKIDLVLINQEKLSVKVKQLHKNTVESPSARKDTDESRELNLNIVNIKEEIEKFESKKNSALTLDVAEMCRQQLLRLKRNLVIAETKLHLKEAEMSIDELTQKIDELHQRERILIDEIKYTDKSMEELMIINTIRELEDKLAQNCLSKEDYETVKNCRDLVEVLSVEPFLITEKFSVDTSGDIKPEIVGRLLVDVFNTNILGKYKDDLEKKIKECKKDNEKRQLTQLLSELNDPVLMKKKERELLALKDIKDGFVFRKYRKAEEKIKFVPKYGQKEIKIIIDFLTNEQEFLNDMQTNLENAMSHKDIVFLQKPIEELDIEKVKEELSSKIKNAVKRINKLENEYKNTQDSRETIQYAISLLLFFRDNYVTAQGKKSSEASKTIDGLNNLLKAVHEKQFLVKKLINQLRTIISKKITIITQLSNCDQTDTPEKQSIRDMIVNFTNKLKTIRDRNVLNTSDIKEFLRKEKDELTDEEREMLRIEKTRIIEMIQQFNKGRKVQFKNTFSREKIQEIPIEDLIEGVKDLLLSSDIEDRRVDRMINKYKLIDLSIWKKWKAQYESKGGKVDPKAFLDSLDFTTYREHFTKEGKKLTLLIDEITEMVIEKDVEDLYTMIKRYKLIHDDDIQKLIERKALFKAELEKKYLPKEYVSLLSKIKKYETSVDKLNAKDKAEYATCKTEIKKLLPIAEKSESEHILRLKQLEDSIKELLHFDTMRQKVFGGADNNMPSFTLPPHNCTREWFLKPWIKGYKGFLVHFIGLTKEQIPERMISSNTTNLVDDEGKDYYDGSIYLDIVLCQKKSQEGRVITFDDNGVEYKVEVLYKKVSIGDETVTVPNDEDMYKKEIDWKQKMDKSIEDKINEFAATRVRDMGENWEKAAGILIIDELQKLFRKENALVIKTQLIEKYKDGTVSDLLLALGNIFVFLDPESKYFSDKTLLFRERLKNGYVSESELVTFTPKDILYELYLLPESKSEKVDEKIDTLIRNFIKKKIYMYLLRHQLTTTQKVNYEIVGNETFSTMFTKNKCVNIIDGSLQDYDIVYYKEDGILYCFSILELLRNPSGHNKYTGKPFRDSFIDFLSKLQIPTLKKKKDVKVDVKVKVPSLLDDLYDDLKQLEKSVGNKEYTQMFITTSDQLTTSIWKNKDDDEAPDLHIVRSDTSDEDEEEEDDEEAPELDNQVNSDTSDEDEDEEAPELDNQVNSDTSDEDEAP